MYADEIVRKRLDACLVSNDKLTLHVRELDSVIRTVCAELGVAYFGRDTNPSELVQAIRRLKTNVGS